MPATPLAHLRRARPAAAAALAAVALTFLVIQAEQARMRAAVSHSREVTRLVREAGRLAVDRETAIRGFLLTGNAELLAPDPVVRGSLVSKLDTLRRVAQSVTVEAGAAATLAAAIAAWDSGYAEPVAAAARGEAPRDAVPGAGVGFAAFQRVRAALTDLLAAEEAVYRSRVRRQRRVAQIGMFALAGEIALLALLFSWHHRTTTRQTQRLVDQQDQLEEQALELEMQAQEAQEAAADLARAVSLTDLLLESMPNGFAVLDAGGRVVRANAALGDLLGVPPAELRGTVAAAAFGQHGGTVADALRRAAEAAAPVTRITLEHGRAGSELPTASWQLSIYPIPGGSSEHAFGCVVVDCTQQAQLERQFQQAQKLEAVGRLAGGVAHDFNNILLAIGTTCELMLADELPDTERHRDLSEALATVRRGAALTRQLLAFTRQQILKPVVLDLNHAVRELEPMLRRLIGADVEIRTRLAPDLRLVEVDPSQIGQIVMNLAVNARDAMPDGGTLIIETANVELDATYAREHVPVEPGPYAMLAVTDTGHGIDAATLARIFDPFFTTKERGKGTGLGLSTVYGIVRQSGGYIWAYSEPGHGATFKIYFPQSPATRATPLPPPPAPAPAAASGGRILLVEDDPAVRDALTRALSASGFEVTSVANGAEALALARGAAGRIDLVVSDVVMPGMTGDRLVAELRRLPSPPRVLLMSGYTHDGAVQLGAIDPATRFIEKPFTLDVLRTKIAEALAGGAGG